nr:GFA family protein [Nannocystis sp.]
MTFDVTGDIPAPDACHCTACRKHSGHYFVSADVPRSALTVRGEENVRWFQSSKTVRRGFCGICGSSLFWDPLGRDWTGVAMGAFDGPTGTHVHVHVFTREKGDYYRIADEAPQFETIPSLPKPPP